MWQKIIFAGKNYFATQVFPKKKLFPPTGKNLQTLHAVLEWSAKMNNKIQT